MSKVLPEKTDRLEKQYLLEKKEYHKRSDKLDVWFLWKQEILGKYRMPLRMCVDMQCLASCVLKFNFYHEYTAVLTLEQTTAVTFIVSLGTLLHHVSGGSSTGAMPPMEWGATTKDLIARWVKTYVNVMTDNIMSDSHPQGYKLNTRLTV